MSNTICINNDNLNKLIKLGDTYFDILLFNCYDIDNKVIDKDKLDKALDDFINVYKDLFDLGLSISGYQFVGIILESNLSLTKELDIRVAYFFLSAGFLFSMHQVFMCYIVMEYVRYIREEDIGFLIVGLNRYKFLFKSVDILFYLNCLLFIIPINILIHDSLDEYFGIIFNTLSVFLYSIGAYIHYTVIMRRQKYNLNEKHIKSAIERHKIADCVDECVNKKDFIFQRKIFVKKKDETEQL